MMVWEQFTAMIEDFLFDNACMPPAYHAIDISPLLIRDIKISYQLSFFSCLSDQLRDEALWRIGRSASNLHPLLLSYELPIFSSLELYLVVKCLIA